jgi:hypothetical protein
MNQVHVNATGLRHASSSINWPEQDFATLISLSPLSVISFLNYSTKFRADYFLH